MSQLAVSQLEGIEMLNRIKADECPEIKRMSVYDPKTYKTYESPNFCRINGKPCLLEEGLECETWNEIQKEMSENA